MELNDAGKIADKCWLEIPDHFPDTILHEYIIMPNHVHGIIELTNTTNLVRVQNVGVQNVGVQNFEPLHFEPLHFEQPNRNNQLRNEFQKIIPRSIGSIIRGYKIGVTKWFRFVRENPFLPHQPVWQRNYYEHIIRNEQSYQTISEYIVNNPSKWDKDRFYR